MHAISSVPGAQGPVCNRVYNDAVVEVECTVSIDGNIPIVQSTTNGTQNCFGPDLAPFDLSSGARRFDTSLAGASAELSYVNSTSAVARPAGLRKRCITQRGTELAGDGNPHQNSYEEQITVSLIYKLSTEEDSGSTNSFPGKRQLRIKLFVLSFHKSWRFMDLRVHSDCNTLELDYGRLQCKQGVDMVRDVCL